MRALIATARVPAAKSTSVFSCIWTWVAAFPVKVNVTPEVHPDIIGKLGG
jgi:hypothetical protein